MGELNFQPCSRNKDNRRRRGCRAFSYPLRSLQGGSTGSHERGRRVLNHKDANIRDVQDRMSGNLALNFGLKARMAARAP